MTPTSARLVDPASVTVAECREAGRLAVRGHRIDGLRSCYGCDLMATVGAAMTKDVRTCRRDDAMSFAARSMLQGRCGCVVVVDSRSNRPVGLLTDRDLALATYTKGSPLQGLRVGQAMSSPVHVCGADDALESAVEQMATAGVRRLAVVDAEGVLVGIVSLSDLAGAGVDVSAAFAALRAATRSC